MPRLPDAEDFGRRPKMAVNRNIVRTDATAPAEALVRSANALQAGYERVGRAAESYAQGGVEAGQNISKIGQDLKQRQDRINLASARSAYLQELVATQSALENDPDYSSYEKKFSDSMSKAKARAFSMIQNQEDRMMFEAETGLDFQRGLADVRQKADTKFRDSTQAFVLDNNDKSIDSALKTKDPIVKNRIINAHNQVIDSAVESGGMTKVQAVVSKQKFAEDYGTAWAMINPEEVLNTTQGKMGPPMPINPLLNRISTIENPSLEPRKVNPKSGATGVLQFMPEVANEFGIDPTNPEQSFAAGEKLLQRNKSVLTKNLGREPTDGEQYLAWQQGASGAAALINNPNANAIDALTTVYDDRSKAESAILDNGGTSEMTAGQFAQKWISRMEGTPELALPSFQATNTPLDFVNPIKRMQLVEGAYADKERALRIQKEQKKIQQQETQNNFFDKFIENPSSLTTQEVLKSNLDAFGEGSKDDFIKLIRKGNTEGNATLHKDLYVAVLNGEIADKAQLVPFLNQTDGVSVQQAQNIASLIEGQRDEAVKMFVTGAKSQITGSSEMMKDPEGDAQFSKFLFDLDRSLQEGAKQQLTPRDLLDPKSKSYIGDKLISTYKRSMDEIINSMADFERQSVEQEVPNAVKPGESVSDWLKRTKQ